MNATLSRGRPLGGLGLVVVGVVVLLLAGMATTPAPELSTTQPDAVVAQEAEDTTDAAMTQTAFEAMFAVRVADLAITPEDVTAVDALFAETAALAFNAGEMIDLPGYGKVELNAHAIGKHGADADLVHAEMSKGGFKKHRCKNGNTYLVKTLGNGVAAFMVVSGQAEVTAFTMPTARAWHTLTRDNCLGGGGFRFAH